MRKEKLLSAREQTPGLSSRIAGYVLFKGRRERKLPRVFPLPPTFSAFPASLSLSVRFTISWRCVTRRRRRTVRAGYERRQNNRERGRGGGKGGGLGHSRSLKGGRKRKERERASTSGYDGPSRLLLPCVFLVRVLKAVSRLPLPLQKKFLQPVKWHQVPRVEG